MLLVSNGKVITRDSNQPYLPNGCILIKDNIIAQVGATSELREQYPDVAFINARG